MIAVTINTNYHKNTRVFRRDLYAYIWIVSGTSYHDDVSFLSAPHGHFQRTVIACSQRQTDYLDASSHRLIDRSGYSQWSLIRNLHWNND
ncbi:hypothetical protein Vau01_094500 [Virgisporangium aurantiacum]|uniref:Uncharacterized protein n=1 Tax=Virgisporangium aurantiacum TaxID=175570 RepID=A0A8J3ZDE7_9ACTN|nr:hypothetical protein Vau01_094500 [Virgisporangium aurantiacum]